MPATRFFADRVKETSTTTGTGNATLAGAAPRSVTFNAAFGLNKTFYYAIEHSSEEEWELGIGFLSASTTLVRQQVLESTNNDDFVNFSAGTKTVFQPLPAYHVNRLSLKGRILAKVAGYDLA